MAGMIFFRRLVTVVGYSPSYPLLENCIPSAALPGGYCLLILQSVGDRFLIASMARRVDDPLDELLIH